MFEYLHSFKQTFKFIMAFLALLAFQDISAADIKCLNNSTYNGAHPFLNALSIEPLKEFAVDRNGLDAPENRFLNEITFLNNNLVSNTYNNLANEECNPLPFVLSSGESVRPNQTIDICAKTTFGDCSLKIMPCTKNVITVTGMNGQGVYRFEESGCISYTAIQKPTATIDSICVLVCNEEKKCKEAFIKTTIKKTSNIFYYPKPLTKDTSIKICLDLNWVTDQSALNVSDCDGKKANTSLNGQYQIDGAGCIGYTVNESVTSSKDSLCIVVCDNTICDTTMIVIPIDTNQNVIYIPTSSKPDVSRELCLNTDWKTDNDLTGANYEGNISGKTELGSYTIQNNGCVNYIANSNPARLVDSLNVVFCDGNNVCDSTILVMRIDTTTTTYLYPNSPLSPDETKEICFDYGWKFIEGITISNCEGLYSGTSSQGSYSILNDGCISYKTNTNPTDVSDTICVRACDQKGRCDERKVIIPIDTSSWRGVMTLDDSFVSGEVFSVCIDTSWANSAINLSTCASSDDVIVGTMIFNEDNCFTYIVPFVENKTVDTLCVIVCDNYSTCDTTMVLISLGNKDSDNDGISDLIEIGSDSSNPIDTDNDGIPDYLDLDTDDDGIPDAIEKGNGIMLRDTDGDGIPNFRDIDSDGDGLLDLLESKTNPSIQFHVDSMPDCNNNGIFDVLDAERCGELLIPETFTPNNDGKNDLFIITGLMQSAPNAKLSVFNRWGSPVFSEEPYQNDWNGIIKGGYTSERGVVPKGVYYYILEPNNGEPIQNGFIYILY